MARKASSRSESAANLGFEQKLWLAADKLRNNMDAAEYKHVVLGLIFLKYISDSFEEHHARLTAGDGDYAGAKQLTDTLGVIEPDLAADLKKLEAAGIPVDIRFQQGLDVLGLVDYAQPANPASAEAPPAKN